MRPPPSIACWPATGTASFRPTSRRSATVRGRRSNHEGMKKIFHLVGKAFLRLSILFSLLLPSACATTRAFVRPAGPATPLADASGIWRSATAACRAARAYRGEVRLSGRINGERIRSATLGLAVDDTGRVGLEA